MIIASVRTSIVLAIAVASALPAHAQQSRAQLDAMIAKHAAANGVPVSLVHRVVIRESRYNPRAVGRGGAMGLMQIKHATARGMGYQGSADGLLDAETNLTYAVRYLAGAFKVAGGNADQAVTYYASGYYYAAKRQGMAGSTAGSSRAERRYRGERRSRGERRTAWWRRGSSPAPGVRNETPP